jgi:hypothetical protein
MTAESIYQHLNVIIEQLAELDDENESVLLNKLAYTSADVIAKATNPTMNKIVTSLYVEVLNSSLEEKRRYLDLLFCCAATLDTENLPLLHKVISQCEDCFT